VCMPSAVGGVFGDETNKLTLQPMGSGSSLPAKHSREHRHPKASPAINSTAAMSQVWKKCLFPDGTVYCGQYVGKVWSGFGTLTFPSGRYYCGSFHAVCFTCCSKFEWREMYSISANANDMG